MIFTSISPNTESDDIALAFRLLFQPWKWKKGNSIQELEKEFSKKFSFSNAYSFQSGRNALYALLEALDLKKDDEVLIQGYTCVAVPEPVLWTGAKPIYVDVSDDLGMNPEDLKKKITLKSRVLVIQHTFGVPAQIDELVAIARSHNIFIIEDCAHAMGTSYKGKPVGSFGDASFFSFGRDKVLSSVFGGMLVVKDSKIAAKAGAIRDAFSYPSFFSIKRQLLHPLIMSFAKSTYNLAGLGKIIIEAFKRIGLIPKAVEASELSGGKPSFVAQKMPNATAALALNQFYKLDRFNEHRRNIVEIYQRELSPIPSQKNGAGGNPIWLRYTVFLNNANDIFKAAKKRSVELGDWYLQSVAPKNVDYKKIGYDPASCPNAERLAKQSVNLPTHVGVTEGDAMKVVQLVK